MAMRSLAFLALMTGPTISNASVNCVAIKRPKVCKRTPECGFDRNTKSCMMLADTPCNNYYWPKSCNKMDHCNWNSDSQQCEANASVECGQVRWPAQCQAANGCGYNIEEDKCVPLTDLSCEQMHGDACQEFPGRCYFLKKSHVCLTLPTVDRRNYKFGGNLKSTCPSGYMAITNVAECRSVAIALNKGWFYSVSALYIDLAGVCTIIKNSPRNPSVNEFMYFGSIGESRALAQNHHKMVCVATAAPTGTPTSAPTRTPTSTPTTIPSIVPSAVPTTTPTEVPTKCEDKATVCAGMAEQGGCHPAHELYFQTMYYECALSCGTCVDMTPDPSAAPTDVPTGVPSTVPTSVPTTCGDSPPDLCKEMARQGKCHDPDDTERAEMLANCRLSCNTCPDAVPTMIPTAVPTTTPTGVPTAVPSEIPCMDHLPKICPEETKAGRCTAADPSERAEMAEKCALSCGLCTPTRRRFVTGNGEQETDNVKSLSLEDDHLDTSIRR